MMTHWRLLLVFGVLVILSYSLYCIRVYVKSTSGYFDLQTSFKRINVDEKTDVFAERRQLLDDVCKSINFPGSTTGPSDGSHIIVNLKHNLGFCNVPKIGSSFWFAVFAILGGKGLGISNPEVLVNSFTDDIQSHLHLHYFSKMSSSARQQFRQTGQMFLFVRNPYKRLLSAYIDKFLSPNAEYWRDFGTTIIAKYRPRASEISRECGHDVTFTEFLRFVVDNPDSDPHWTSINRLCSPCHHKYNFIGHLDTFAGDTKELLRLNNLSHIIHYDPDEGKHVKLYMAQKIEQYIYHFNLTGNCLSGDDLIVRLWKSFQVKGYIKVEDNPPVEELLRHFGDVLKFKAVLLNTSYARYVHMSEEDKYLNSEQFIIEMYAKVPLDTRNEIKRTFLTDFLLFGYANASNDPFKDVHKIALWQGVISLIILSAILFQFSKRCFHSIKQRTIHNRNVRKSTVGHT